jgi:hypothetical protein
MTQHHVPHPTERLLPVQYGFRAAVRIFARRLALVGSIFGISLLLCGVSYGLYWLTTHDWNQRLDLLLLAIALLMWPAAKSLVVLVSVAVSLWGRSEKDRSSAIQLISELASTTASALRGKKEDE